MLFFSIYCIIIIGDSMIESDSKKKDIFYLIVLLLTLIATIVSATIAYYKLIASQKDEETVLYTGTLEVNYIDGVYIKNPTLWPVNNVDYNTYDKIYRNNFKVTSTGTLNQIISISMIIESNEFEKENLKYSLYNSLGEEMTSGYVPQEGEINLTSNLYLEHGTTATYTLLVWLDNKNYNQNGEMGKTITGRIRVDAVQVKH